MLLPSKGHGIIRINRLLFWLHFVPLVLVLVVAVVADGQIVLKISFRRQE